MVDRERFPPASTKIIDHRDVQREEETHTRVTTQRERRAASILPAGEPVKTPKHFRVVTPELTVLAAAPPSIWRRRRPTSQSCSDSKSALAPAVVSKPWFLSYQAAIETKWVRPATDTPSTSLEGHDRSFRLVGRSSPFMDRNFVRLLSSWSTQVHFNIYSEFDCSCFCLSLHNYFPREIN